MFSYTFFFLSSILLTYPSKKYIDQFSSYGIIFFSIVLAYYLTGLTALLLILSNLSKFPIIIISIVTFLSLLKFI